MYEYEILVNSIDKKIYSNLLIRKSSKYTDKKVRLMLQIRKFVQIDLKFAKKG